MIRLARQAAGVSQKQLGEACGISQSAVSRMEGHGAASYDMNQLARTATHLQIPLRQVGLAEHAAVRAAPVDRMEVERRSFLAGAAVAATGPALAAFDFRHASAAENDRSATLRLATSAYRRMDGSTPSRQLAEPVLAHLRLARTLAGEAEDSATRARLAAVGSEVAGLAGWLSWDMGDHGSARTWYGTAVKAARSSRDRLLTAYQSGSLAQFEAHAGNAAQALSLTRSARRQLGRERPAIAAAWLSTVEALAHAAAGDRASTDQALKDAMEGATRITVEEPPPWPWVFTFSPGKVAAARLACGSRLGLPQWVFEAQDEAGPVLASGHAKQRAVYVLDMAAAHLASGRIDGAFALATQALETGVHYRSGRIVEKARSLRRDYVTASPPGVVRDFDDRLHGVHL
ncbi:helix-turn-helix domain-containing protein [Streptomyces nanshensis]|uniref:helix-turn-helix domain-containing protein n=1 Tax=Streptomyces nanshensis TaxID=518642 RepID=UPI001FD16D4B|nr:helix-turn-helix transcriptional regulator [Streptomyces nanshensis]